MLNRNDGFTRVELTLTLACMVVLTAVVLPAAAKEREFAFGAAAHAQVDQMLRGVRLMMEDARMRPKDGGYGTFAGEGALPVCPSLGATQPLELLTKKVPPPALSGGMQGSWRGPYSIPLKADPWGRAFILTSFGDHGLYIWCVSAGSNGILDTTSHDRWLQGDDVGMRIY